MAQALCLLHANCQGDALRPLLSPVLFEAFSNGISQRLRAGEKETLTLFTIQEAHITAARVEGRHGFVTVEFVSDQTKMPASGPAPRAATRVTDIWTFRRELGSPDPNWMLVETKTA